MTPEELKAICQSQDNVASVSMVSCFSSTCDGRHPFQEGIKEFICPSCYETNCLACGATYEGDSCPGCCVVREVCYQ